jgi:hypothetical protein
MSILIFSLNTRMSANTLMFRVLRDTVKCVKTEWLTLLLYSLLQLGIGSTSMPAAQMNVRHVQHAAAQ